MRGDSLSYLYVTENGAKISINGGYYTVTSVDGSVKQIPKEILKAVALLGNVSVTTPCIKDFLMRGIPVSYFGETGFYFGKFNRIYYENAKRLKKQIYLSDDEFFALELGKKIIQVKINNQITILRRYGKRNIETVQNSINNMKNAKYKLDFIHNRKELMGYEGTAAKSYFGGLSKLVREDFKFKSRSKHPPKNPFNAMISFGYTMLINELCGVIESRGLSPYFGFIHEEYGKIPALACDLIEEWRTVIVDSVALSLITRKEIDLKHFIYDEISKGCFLDKAGKDIFIRKYETKMKELNKYSGKYPKNIRSCIWHQVDLLSKAIDYKDCNLYKPFIIR